MINRHVATCAGCCQEFILRAVVPLATTDALRFCCPLCGIEHSAELSLDLSVPAMALNPKGFTCRDWLYEQLPMVVTVSTDLPVHRVKHTKPLHEGGSPFLWMTIEMGPAVVSWKAKVDALQHLRQNTFDDLNKLVAHARARQWDAARRTLEEDFSITLAEPVTEDAVIYECYRAMNLIYAAFMSVDEMADTLEEYFEHLNDCCSNKTAAYQDLLRAWSTSDEFNAVRTKALNTLTRILKNFDAFIVGLLVDQMPLDLRTRIDEFRIYRDDYHVVKALYQDLFELTSQALIFGGAIINLSKRGNPWHYATGISSYTAFKKATAFERFQILSETPRLAGVLGEVSRPMRNTIGHFAADYDPCSGNIRYDDGTILNYLAFLGEFFAAVKALRIILVMVEKADLDMSRLLSSTSAA